MAPCKRNYLQEATPTSCTNQPMAEQTGQQATRIKGAHSDQRDSFIQKGVTNNTHQERTHQDRRPDARLPSHVVMWTRHTTAHPGHPAAAHQHQSQPSQFHHGPLANQPHDQRFIIARGLPEASSLHGNTALHHGQHHSTADDK